MLGVSDFEKIFKGQFLSKRKLPIFCHGMMFDNDKLKDFNERRIGIQQKIEKAAGTS